MQLKKTLKIEMETSNGKEMRPGNEYVMSIDGRTTFGIFVGIAKKRGALTFFDRLTKQEYSVMPASIKEIYEAKLLIVDGLEQEDPDEA